MSGVRIVAVMEDEDGETAFAHGHVEPALMVLSAVACHMQMVGADEAMRVLVGGPSRWDPAKKDWRRSPEEQVEHANAVLASVRHVWLRQDPDNDEAMLPSTEGEDGAEAWTTVALPW
ncbi:MAG: hypothetical protein ACLGI3_14260 [Actinomycetes bacterium]